MYSTIPSIQAEKPSVSRSWVIGTACVLGFVVGLAFTSANASSSLYTAQGVRTLPAAVMLPRAQPVAPHQLSAIVSEAAAASAETPLTFQGPTSSPIQPLILAGSAAVAVGWALMKFLAPKQVSMMSTTAVKREWAAQSGKKYKSVHPIIAPSLLAADLANLAFDSKRVMDAGADVLHVDVMDGHFVPNLSWGAPVIKCLRQHTNAFFDTHLMVSNPEDFIAPMKDAGVDQFTFHIEAAKDPKGLIKAIKDAGMKVGISVKPKTPVESVFPYVNDVDLILVMTVEPGFGGQSFMEDMMPKVKTLREKYPNLEIQVDGGLSPKTIDAAAKAGANAIVAGSACFVADPKGAIDAMRASVEKYCTGPGQ